MDWARRIELVTVVVAALVAVAGLWYSNVQTRQANEQAQQANTQARDDRALDKEGQITDRYTAAVGNLGEDKMDVRLGGIYALQRIMQDSRRDQPTIANVLASYIRTHAAKPPAKGQDVSADVHAALTVLATRDRTRDGAFHLDLHGVKLPNINLSFADVDAALHGADLSGADLSGANLTDADLSGADLSGADLRSTELGEADLSGAYLGEADLTDAYLGKAKLRYAHLGKANLRGTSLVSADLRRAILSEADLRGAVLLDADLRSTDVTKQQVDSAIADSSTRV
ncbi:pentapeptide repeat-containing protein [Streptomyces anulatus]|uniref:pentapeptide repeat-containing protein n=1 Tax=Streptomyces anulatus TaxID=1892 RepID=UPI002F9178A9|nr:pentapeptide repeat-containing protein [Streptomyces anulatus]